MFSSANDDVHISLNMTAIKCVNLKHCAPLVEIELDSRDELLLLRSQVLRQRGRKSNGALRYGGVGSHTPPQPGISTDLQ